MQEGVDLRPQDPKYAYTLAFYQYHQGDKDAAVNTLEAFLAKYPQHKDAEMLLKEIAK